MNKLNMLKTASYLFCFSLLFSCKKNDNPIDIDNPIFTPGSLVTASFTGRITDINNVPISGATVSAGGKTTTTDINGQFTISNASVSDNAALVKVAKNGFFMGYRTLVVEAGATHFVSLALITKGTAQVFSAATGGNVSLGSGCNVQFPAGSMVVQSSGAAYNGSVRTFGFFLNPADANFNAYMPGDLRGINTANNERLLQSYGMLIVEMEGSGGERLQLAPGKTANITLPIVTALQATAPDSIPLWHFDEAIGMWKEEGKAAKQGNEYKGTVSHFSFWNCDAPFSLLRYSATFKDQQGNPIPYCKVGLKRPNGEIRYGNANNLGFLEALIPYNEALVMTVFANCSGVVLLTNNIGPYQASVNAGTITVNNFNPTPLQLITGTVVGCNGLPVSTGYVQTNWGGAISRTPIMSGSSFSLPIQTCPGATSSVALVAYDSSTGLTSPAKIVTLTGAGPINAGQLVIDCNNISTGSITLSIDSSRLYWLSSATDSLYGLRYYDAPIISYSTRVIYQSIPLSANTPYCSFTFNGPGSIGPSGIGAPGNYLLTSFQYLPNGTANPATGYTLSPTSMGIAPAVITLYGSVGNYIQGSFNAFAERNGIAYPVQCSFKIRRVA